jgi:hypothetical protein
MADKNGDSEELTLDEILGTSGKSSTETSKPTVHLNLDALKEELTLENSQSDNDELSLDDLSQPPAGGSAENQPHQSKVDILFDMALGKSDELDLEPSLAKKTNEAENNVGDSGKSASSNNTTNSSSSSDSDLDLDLDSDLKLEDGDSQQAQSLQDLQDSNGPSDLELLDDSDLPEPEELPSSEDLELPELKPDLIQEPTLTFEYARPTMEKITSVEFEEPIPETSPEAPKVSRPSMPSMPTMPSMVSEEKAENKNVQVNVNVGIPPKNYQSWEDFSQDHRDLVNFHENELSKLSTIIRGLREDRSELMAKLDSLQDEVRRKNQENLNLQAELEETRIEFTLIKKNSIEEIEELKYQLKMIKTKKETLEKMNKNYQNELQILQEKFKFDVLKVRERESELESKVEFLKVDSFNQTQTREEKIIELKRQIEMMEFDRETFLSNLKKSKDNELKLMRKLELLQKTLKASVGLIDVEEAPDQQLAKRMKI